MTIDFATFLAVAPHVLNSRLPVLIRGKHGVGKSQVVYQIAEERKLPVVERRASQMTEGDLLGLPDTADTQINGRKATTWNAPDWLVTACEQPVCLFLDEVDRATLEVRQGLFELTDSRKLNGWNLHPETLIIAAVNGGEHGAQYQVGEMDPAELDRWTVFDVEPVQLRDFVEKYEWQVSVEDILDKGDFSKTSKWGINDHSAMIEKFDAAGVFKPDLSDDQITNLAEYFVSLPSEVAMKLWSVLGDTDNINNVVSLHKAETKNGAKVSEHLVEILGGGDDQ
jgi:hypothetical protein